MLKNSLSLYLVFSCALTALPLLAQFPGADRVLSPEIADDNTVTFRIRAPQATEVQLSSSGDIPQIPFGQSLPMEKDADGIWSITLGPMDPGAYRYNFSVDGVATLDQVNTGISLSNDNPWSLFVVEGSDFMDTRNVPHGAVAEVTYYSGVLEKFRRMHVYTPPGFEQGGGPYPVFYLLHGAMDSDHSWSSVGRANMILDNLIAQGRAEPMIVVMPAGHTGPFIRGASGLGIDEFATEFREDIKPLVESRYPVSTARADTAIAGLSMGGAHTLEIAFSDLAEYAWVGVYSSGVFSINQDDSWQQAHQDALDNADLKPGLELLWFSTGSEDFLLDTTRATVEMLDKHGFDVTYIESAGGHTWINWREYLKTFAQQLFKQ